MKTKKKVLVAALAIALVAIAVGGSLAWFADTDEVKNVFTVGSIDIEQKEVFDKDTAQLLPVVGTDPTNSDDNYIEKKVTVSNVGKNDAYVQTYVAVPAVLDNNGVLKLYDANCSTNGWTKVDGDDSTAGIQPVATGITITGGTILYNVYLYRYNEKLVAPAATQTTSETLPCLEYVYIDSLIDLNTYDLKDAQGNEGTDNVIDTAYFVLTDGTEIKDFNAAGELNVYVATQAVQERGFADAATALKSAFPNHPWAE